MAERPCAALGLRVPEPEHGLRAPFVPGNVHTYAKMAKARGEQGFPRVFRIHLVRALSRKRS